MQGLGSALFEQLVTADGQLLNPNLIDYRVPTFTDLPDTFGTVLIENADGTRPYGAKGVGESGMFCVAPAIGNAVARAIGVRIWELPLTPERVWRTLREEKPSERCRHCTYPHRCCGEGHRTRGVYLRHPPTRYGACQTVAQSAAACPSQGHRYDRRCGARRVGHPHGR